MNGTVLMTGASGFIGRHLSAALAHDGFRVRAASRQPKAILPSARVEPVGVGDFRQPIDWTPLLDGVDAVVHLAAIAHQDPGKVAAAEYRRINGDAVAELARQCRAAGTAHLVFLSSISAQAEFSARDVVTEQKDGEPAGPYGRSKMEAEAAVRASGVGYTIFRPVVVYGPGVRGNVGTLLRLADSPWPLPFASFHNRRSLLAVDNLVAAILFALAGTQPRNETYIVADPSALSLAEIISTLRAALGRPARLFPAPPAAFRAGLTLAGRGEHWRRIGGSLVVDPAKLLAAGWKPRIDTPAGLTQFALAATRTTS
jgi:UDP-glucose 4-epimerase